jgi:hypothetical protein
MVEIYFLVVFAIIVDLINWIPFINVPVSIAALIVFPWYFKAREVPAYPTVISGLIGLIPGLSALPETIAGVIACIILDRMLASRLSMAIVQKGLPAIQTAAPELRIPIAIAEKTKALKRGPEGRKESTATPATQETI